MPTGAFNICCPRDCVSRHNGGTRGAPIIPRDIVYNRRDIEFEFIMVDCQNFVCIRSVRLGVLVTMVYRPPSDSGAYLKKI